MKKCERSGFSLIELLVVMGIMGILATIALPQMVSQFRQFKLTQSTNAVMGALRTARAHAIKEFREVKAIVNLDKEIIRFEICNKAGDCSDDDGGDDTKVFEKYSELSTLRVMDGVDLYGMYHPDSVHKSKSGSGYHSSKSAEHPIIFLPSGTRREGYLLMTYKPNPPADEANACEYNTIHVMSTGQPRILRSADPAHTENSFGGYHIDFDSFKYRSPPACAK